MSNNITCPSCQAEIAIDQALSAQLSQRIRQELEAEVRIKESRIADAQKKLAEEKLAIERTQASLAEQITAGVELQRKAILTEAAKAAEAKLGVEMKDQQSQVEELTAKLKLSQSHELQLRERERKLEAEKQELKLAAAREVDAQRASIREEALKQFSEEHRMKDAEYQKTVSDMKRQIDDLKRKAEQGSQQIQGEVQEIALEELLEATFRTDAIEPVAKGVNGADTLQRVCCSSGVACGSILWESKRTKAFSKDWLPKLRVDQRSARASCAVIVTQTLPDGVDNFALIDGVWVCSWACVKGLATALRVGIIESSKIQLASQGRAEKMEVVYNYLSGKEFHRCVEGIVEAFVTMSADLDKEKRAMKTIWKRREKQIDLAIGSTAGLYGDLQGIFGTALPRVEGLSLPVGSGPEPALLESQP